MKSPDNQSAMTFKVGRLINPDSVYGYPKIATSPESKRVIQISDDYVSIDTIHKNDEQYFWRDYQMTEDEISFDLHFLDELIEKQIAQNDYGITVYHNEDLEINITYRSRHDDEYKELDLSMKDSGSNDLVNSIHSLFAHLK